MNGESVVLWDIDGTLLDTQGAGVGPLAKSIEESTGRSVILDREKHAGKSDYEIIGLLSGLSASNHSEELQFEIILENYVKGLALNLKVKPATVLGDTIKTLEWLQNSRNIRIGLLSGNCEAGGREKLISANLLRFFKPELCFFASFRLSNRESVLASVLERHPKLVIVGDTPNDIEAGITCNTPVISVATGLYSWSELDQINKDFVLREDWKLKDFSKLLAKVI
jgi:phosphoglycolate phosphatase